MEVDDSEPCESGLEPGWLAECNAEVLEWAEDPLGTKAKQRVKQLESVLLPFVALAREMRANPDARRRPDAEPLEVVYTETDGDLDLGDFRRLLEAFEAAP